MDRYLCAGGDLFFCLCNILFYSILTWLLEIVDGISLKRDNNLKSFRLKEEEEL